MLKNKGIEVTVASWGQNCGTNRKALPQEIHVRDEKALSIFVRISDVKDFQKNVKVKVERSNQHVI